MNRKQQIGKKYSYGDSISGLDTACKPLKHLAKGMMMRNKNRLLQRQHDVLRLRADAELAAPDANAAGDVEASVALCERTIGALVDGILNP